MEAEALFLSLEALRLHRETGFSPRSGLYTAARRLSAGVEELRLARRVLHIYSIKRRAVSNVLRELFGDVELGWKAKTLIELFISSILGGIRLGDPRSLAVRLRRVMGRDWPEEIEPYLGLLRSLQSLKLEAEENYPGWFVRYLKKILGRAGAGELMRFQDESRPPIYAAVNPLKLGVERILETAERKGVKLSPDRRLPGIYLVEAERTGGLVSMMRSGLISVHDFSSYYAVKALDPRPGEVILDVCAAPGTKTWLMAVKMRNRGRIVSVDSSKPRLRAHRRRMRAMGVEIVEQVEADATKPLPLRLEADRVLVDPPCSSTGLFWREPAYRWSVKPRHVRMFMRLQARILDSAAEHIRQGGLLLYSTCSVTLEENELVIEDFLKTHPNFMLIGVEPALGSPGLRGLGEARRLYPHRDQCNGFFLAALVRRY